MSLDFIPLRLCLINKIKQVTPDKLLETVNLNTFMGAFWETYQRTMKEKAVFNEQNDRYVIQENIQEDPGDWL